MQFESGSATIAGCEAAKHLGIAYHEVTSAFAKTKSAMNTSWPFISL
jgi:hypothetical protein